MSNCLKAEHSARDLNGKLKFEIIKYLRDIFIMSESILLPLISIISQNHCARTHPPAQTRSSIPGQWAEIDLRKHISQTLNSAFFWNFTKSGLNEQYPLALNIWQLMLVIIPFSCKAYQQLLNGHQYRQISSLSLSRNQQYSECAYKFSSTFC